MENPIIHTTVKEFLCKGLRSQKLRKQARCSGCYAFFDGDQCLYVGMSEKSICDRICYHTRYKVDWSHFNFASACLTEYALLKPLTLSLWIVPKDEAFRLETTLIKMLQPSLNDSENDVEREWPSEKIKKRVEAKMTCLTTKKQQALKIQIIHELKEYPLEAVFWKYFVKHRHFEKQEEYFEEIPGPLRNQYLKYGLRIEMQPLNTDSLRRQDSLLIVDDLRPNKKEWKWSRKMYNLIEGEEEFFKDILNIVAEEIEQAIWDDKLWLVWREAYLQHWRNNWRMMKYRGTFVSCYEKECSGILRDFKDWKRRIEDVREDIKEMPNTLDTSDEKQQIYIILDKWKKHIEQRSAEISENLQHFPPNMI